MSLSRQDSPWSWSAVDAEAEYGEEDDNEGERDDREDRDDDAEDDEYDEGGARQDADEDTEEASETDMGNHDDPAEIKEQMYRDKLANLRMQLQQLRENAHPEFARRGRRLEQQYEERLRLNEIHKEYLLECINQDFIMEKKAAVKEFDEKKIELKDNLIADFEDKKKHIENERHNMELNGDSMEVKPAMTRKLRRRPNEPAPIPDKRRKPLPTTLTYQLDDRDIEADLRQIARARPPSVNQPRKNHSTPQSPLLQAVETTINTALENRVPSPLSEVRVEDGKLLYEKRWYHRGQSIFVEGQDYSRFPAHITAIGSDCIWVKKATAEGNKMKLYTSLLARGKITIKRRAS